MDNAFYVGFYEAGGGAKVAVERAVKELQELRLEAASSLIIPERTPPTSAGRAERDGAAESRSRRRPGAVAAGLTQRRDSTCPMATAFGISASCSSSSA
jgi:hypothetical protein